MTLDMPSVSIMEFTLTMVAGILKPPLLLPALWNGDGEMPLLIALAGT